MSNGTDDQGIGGIVQCQIDIATGRKLSPSRCIWQGTGGRYLEAPQLGTAQTKYLSSEVAGGFTGVIIGLYACGKGSLAEFSNFKCEYP